VKVESKNREKHRVSLANPPAASPTTMQHFNQRVTSLTLSASSGDPSSRRETKLTPLSQ
jgi:hypothetical protein